jgi:hypothetical protein
MMGYLPGVVPIEIQKVLKLLRSTEADGEWKHECTQDYGS